MSQTIEVVVAPDGQATVQTQGFIGNECRQASQFLEAALGQRGAETLTAEFYQSQATHTQTELRQ